MPNRYNRRPMPVETLYIRSRSAERVKRVQAFQHMFAALLLIVNGWDHLGHGGVLAYFEVAAGALLIATAIRERVRKTHSRVGWLEIAGAVMMFVEAFAQLHVRHHKIYYVLIFVQPLVLLFFGIFEIQINRRRYLKIDDEGLEMRTRPFWKSRVPLTGVRMFRFEKNLLVLGERKLKLKDIINREEADGWLRKQLTARGIEEQG